MSNTESKVISHFNEVVDECDVFTFITRDSDLQRMACEALEEVLTMIADEKTRAIDKADEEYANILLGCQCLGAALIAEIKMWLLLKEERPDQAWEELINAQMSFNHATKAHPGFEHLISRVDRLNAVEHIVFPPQAFLSSGMIVKTQICTVCGEEYEDCQHVKGRPYMGEFCAVKITPFKVDHISLVDNPANKLCRVLRFGVEGGYRNKMTWRVERSEKEMNTEVPSNTEKP